ncbi:MAG: ATP-grasp domain-containing protein [Syntrophaceae bacterium]
MEIKSVFVFPCGSEIGLEIHRSLRYSRHINLIGGSSVDDHGRFVYSNYISNIPFFNEANFIPLIKGLVNEYQIDAVYPSMDSVIAKLAEYESFLGCKIIGSPSQTTKICLSKTRTYYQLRDVILTPKIYESTEPNIRYPVFAKPDEGYGTRGAKKIHSFEQMKQHLIEYPNSIILEYLPGKEYTVDCFTDRKRNLLFAGPRPRRRILNGISVNTISHVDDITPFMDIAKKINQSLNLRGAWFFQVKENESGELVLLEVAARLGGSSALYRNLGVNFALLSIFDAFDKDVDILYNPTITIELDRALNNRYKLDFIFEEVYIDFDDCLVIDGKVNTDLIGFIYKCINKGIKVSLLTRHERSLEETLKMNRLNNVFDSIVNIKNGLPKSLFIKNAKAIFIDDSFAERKEVYLNKRIPVFSPDACECLLGD